MGSSAWSDTHYADKAKVRAATGTSPFAYSDAAMRGPASARVVNDKMDPKGVKQRESRDSDTHPESRAVVVLFDVTGSMSSVPATLQANLPKLMGLLIRKGYISHPQIMIGAIGDATCDKAPLQIGQFESGIEIEDDLSKLLLEGGGGGHITESYELAMYFVARHTSLDCLEKRNQRGYLFIIGDEIPYLEVSKDQVNEIIGDSLQENLKTMDVVTELRNKYDIYFILPNLTNNFKNPSIHKRWAELLGQNVLRLEDPAAICELIASTIGLTEGAVDLDGVRSDLVDVGSKDAATVVSSALATLSKDRGALATVPDSGVASGIVRL